jgi:hypothetical protein
MGATSREADNDPATRPAGTAREPIEGDAGAGAGPVNLVPVLAERFTLVRFLGGGGEGNALLVEEKETGSRFVVKQYGAGWSAKAEVLERLIAARAGHSRRSWAADARLRSVLWLDAYGEDPSWGISYEVQEFIVGGSLEALDVWPARDLAAALAETVDAFHQVAGAHRDVKPGNVLVRSLEGPVLVLADVGLARVVGESSKHYSRRDGTAAYQAPEASHGEVSQAGDWWSVGMIVAQAALGWHPLALPDGSLPDERQMQAELAQRDVPHLDRITDPRVRLLCQGLLTRDADRRWGGEQVSQWLAGESPTSAFAGAVPATAVSTGAPRRVRSVRFAGTEHLSSESLAAAFAADPALAGRLLFAEKDELLREDVRLMLSSAGLHDAQGILDSYRSGPWEPALLRLLAEMDPGLTPSLAGQSMTPEAIAAMARDIVNSAGATTVQRASLAWVVEHRAWQVWRRLPGMEQAADAADRLGPLDADVRHALGRVGLTDAQGRCATLVLDALGQVRAVISAGSGIEQPTLVGPDVVAGFWETARWMERAWTVLQIVAPDDTARELSEQLERLRPEFIDQPWWTDLADSRDTGGWIVAILAASLARSAAIAKRHIVRSQDEERRRLEDAREAEARAMAQATEARIRLVEGALVAYDSERRRLRAKLDETPDRPLLGPKVDDLMAILIALRYARFSAEKVFGVSCRRPGLPDANKAPWLPAELRAPRALRDYLVRELEYQPVSTIHGTNET